MAIKLHPSIDKGVKAGNKKFKGGTLTCHCASDPVTVSIKGNVAHNHACGCTKCWKPAGAVFSVVAVVAADNLSVTGNAHKLNVVDAQRHHPAPRVQRLRRAHVRAHREHAVTRSTGSTSCTWSCRRTRAGTSPSSRPSCRPSSKRAPRKPKDMKKVRDRLKKLRLAPYDCLSPPLMDAIATHVAKRRAR